MVGREDIAGILQGRPECAWSLECRKLMAQLWTPFEQLTRNHSALGITSFRKLITIPVDKATRAIAHGEPGSTSLSAWALGYNNAYYVYRLARQKVTAWTKI